MLDLTDKMVVANAQGDMAILNDTADYHRLGNDWFYVVGGGKVTYADLDHRITRAGQAYQEYEAEF